MENNTRINNTQERHAITRVRWNYVFGFGRLMQYRVVRRARLV